MLTGLLLSPVLIYVLHMENNKPETLLTPTEAAVLTGLPLKAVNNAIDRKTVAVVPGEEGGRLLDARALVSLSIERRLSDRLATPELRRKIFDALAAMSCRLQAA
jgi:hypothetical protein